MTAREEDILANQNLIKKGIVLDKLFESVLVEPGVNANDVYIGDKNAILMATRILGYGHEYRVDIEDDFNAKDTVIVDLRKIQTKDIDLGKLNRENLYTFTTPTTKNVIEFKLLVEAGSQ